MKHYANICKSVYEVRVHAGAAEIMYDGKWLDSGAFIDALISAGKRDEVRELALYGLRTHPEECMQEITKELAKLPPTTR